jgi:D-arginine dehydrogenase
VIGGGMAGASLAAELARHASVILLEAESQPGYHSTGRSAAFWSETYGGPLVQPLTSVSGPFLATPPVAFSERSFLSPRGAIHVAEGEGQGALDAFLKQFAGSGVDLKRIDSAALRAAIPGLRSGWTSGVEEVSCMDIDVGGLHAAYLRAARSAGATLLTNAPVESGVSRGAAWELETPRGVIAASKVVNAAGAWADDVAEAVGVQAIGIRPYRRTMAQLRVDPPVSAEMPLIIDALGRFYFKPEAGGRIWLSPHDETPCGPCDSAPEELDVAVAIDRLQQVVDWRVERVEHSWAGLRSFAPDRLPVYGFDREAAGFFWFAGQGGFGIQTAPAAAKLAAALLLGHAPDPLVEGIDPAPYSARRFMN